MKGNFAKLVKGEKPVLIDFHALWCGPCKMQTPILKELAKELKDEIRIIKIDIDKNPKITQRYQIRGVPTLALFKGGNIIWQQSGVQSKHQILEAIKQNV